MPTIFSPLSEQFIESAKNQYIHLNNIQLSDCNVNKSDSQIDVLIGADDYWDFMTGEVKPGSKDPVAIKTILGWVLNWTFQAQGSSQTSANFCDSHVLKISAIEQKSICNDKFTRFWKIENSNKKENFSMSEFIQKVEFSGQKYQTPLPWKNDHEFLPVNFLLAKNRLVSLVNLLTKDPIVLKTYDNIIKSEEAERITEGPTTILKPPGQVHYLPHHPVIRLDKSATKLRVVYDDSSSFEGPSLN